MNIALIHHKLAYTQHVAATTQEHFGAITDCFSAHLLIVDLNSTFKASLKERAHGLGHAHESNAVFSGCTRCSEYAGNIIS